MSQPKVISARYHILKTLYSHDSGATYLVRDSFTDEEQVLKCTRILDKIESRDLLNEFSRLISLTHPSIVQPRDLGYDPSEKMIYMTTDYIPGQDLKAWWQACRDAGKLSTVFIKIVQALQALHRRQLVHGDIKPQNIIVHEDSPRLIDFGFSSLKGTGDPRGTPLYMAPEVKEGHPPDMRSDLFSLGASFWNILTDLDLSDGEPKPDTLILKVPAVSRQLAGILCRLLEPDPEKRAADPGIVLELLKVKERWSSWRAALPFAGRGDIMKAWEEGLETGGPGPVLLLIGPPGIGKTTLLRRMKWAAQLKGRSCIMVDGKHARIEDIVSSRREMFDVILVDDWDPVDERCMSLLRDAAIGSAGRSPIVAIACEGPLRKDMIPSVGTNVLRIPAFGPEEIHEVLEQTWCEFDTFSRQRLQEMTAAVPLLVQEGVEFFSEQGYLPSEILAPLPGMRRYWEERLQKVSPVERETLEWLALLDKAVPMDVLKRLVPSLGHETLERLEGFCMVEARRGVFRSSCTSLARILSTGSEDEARKRRSLLGLPILDEVEKLIHALLAREHVAGEDIERMKRELMSRGRSRDLEKLLEAVLLCGRASERERRESAFLLLRLALVHERGKGLAELVRLLEEHLDEDQRRCFEAACAYQEGDLESAERLLRPLFDAALKGGREEVHALAMDLYLKILVRLGRYDEARALGDTILGEIREHPARASILYSQARASYFLGNVAQGRACVREGVERACEPREKIVGLGLSGLMETALGNLHESRRRYEEALAAIESCRDAGADLEGSTLLNLGLVYFQLCRLKDSLASLERALTIARRGRDTALELGAIVNLANIYCFLNKGEECLHYLAEARSLASKSRMEIVLAQADLVEAEHRMNVGMTGDAKALLLAARRRFQKLGVRDRLLEAMAAEGMLAGLLNDVTGLKDVLARLAAVEVPSHLQGKVAYLKAIAGPLDREEAAGLLWEAQRKAQDSDTAALIMSRLQEAYDHGGEKVLGRIAACYGYGILLRAALSAPEPGAREFWDIPWRKALKERYESEIGRERLPGAFSHARLLRLQKKIMEEDGAALLSLVMDEAVDMTQAERGFLLLREEGRKFRIAVARNIDRETVRKPEFKVSRTIAQEAFDTGTPLLSLSAQDDTALSKSKSVHLMGLKSVLCVPIRGRECIRGAIYLDNRFVKGMFGGEHLELMTTLADLLAIALENIGLRDRLIEQNTQLKELNSMLGSEMERKEREVLYLKEEVQKIKESLCVSDKFPGIIGRSRSMEGVLSVVEKIAPSSLPVVIEGETGTGKELIARAIHESGPRRGGPFVAVNCGALPETLLESELFGYVRGAFTGASQDKKGLITQARGGDLFLDELEAMPLSMQVKLLRVMEDGELRPLGSERSTKVDVRILAAANTPLRQLRESGRLRDDLFYRLNVLQIRLPPLRERKEDIPLLAEFFLQKAAGASGAAKKAMTPAAMKLLVEYEWPGNVRQLENVILTSALTASGDWIGPLEIPEEISGWRRARLSRKEYREAMAGTEKELLLKTLKEAGGNKVRAARLLGISRPTLYRKLQRAGRYGQ